MPIIIILDNKPPIILNYPGIKFLEDIKTEYSVEDHEEEEAPSFQFTKSPLW